MRLSSRPVPRVPANKPLVVTAGEPAGIGPELCNALADSPFTNDVVVIGDQSLLRRDLNVIDIPFPVPVTPGKPHSANAQTLLDGLARAVDGCLAGEFSGLVTAPLAKRVIADAGIPFIGHTEYLAERTNSKLPVMMLVAGDLRVALASTHLPLRAVADYITADRLRTIIAILDADLKTRFGIEHPEIVVCGLNPHAGEGGHLGTEDDAIIRPLVEELSAQGIRLRGPLPADTAFTPAGGGPKATKATIIKKANASARMIR